jgi:hypothetical protein
MKTPIYRNDLAAAGMIPLAALVIILLLNHTGPAQAQDDPTVTEPAERRVWDGIGEHDLNGDGILDLSERAKLLEARRAASARFDLDGDGHLNAAERTAATLAWLKESKRPERPRPLAQFSLLLRQFDLNQDGHVDEEEWALFAAEVRARRQAADSAQEKQPDAPETTE